MATEHTRDIHVQAALQRSGGRPQTPASNRFRLLLARAVPGPRNGNSRGTNGMGSARQPKSIK